MIDIYKNLIYLVFLFLLFCIIENISYTDIIFIITIITIYNIIYEYSTQYVETFEPHDVNLYNTNINFQDDNVDINKTIDKDRYINYYAAPLDDYEFKDNRKKFNDGIDGDGNDGDGNDGDGNDGDGRKIKDVNLRGKFIYGYSFLHTDYWSMPMKKKPVCKNIKPCNICPMKTKGYNMGLLKWDLKKN